MEITIKKTVEEKFNIELPAFFRSKSKVFYYKVFSKDHCIQIFGNEIGVKHATIFTVLDYEPCSESEFLDIYNQVNDSLCQLATV
jgi:hypothetical protein